MILMVLSGLAIMIYTLFNLISGRGSSSSAEGGEVPIDNATQILFNWTTY